MKKFVSSQTLWDRADPSLRNKIGAEVGAFILAEDAALVKGPGIRALSGHAQSFGAKIFAEMPDGSKVSLSFDGRRATPA